MKSHLKTPADRPPEDRIDLCTEMLTMEIGDELNYAENYHFLRVAGGWVCTVLVRSALGEARSSSTCFVPEPPRLPPLPAGRYDGPE